VGSQRQTNSENDDTSITKKKKKKKEKEREKKEFPMTVWLYYFSQNKQICSPMLNSARS
jgi:hypothetical protein